MERERLEAIQNFGRASLIGMLVMDGHCRLTVVSVDLFGEKLLCKRWDAKECSPFCRANPTKFHREAYVELTLEDIEWWDPVQQKHFDGIDPTDVYGRGLHRSQRQEMSHADVVWGGGY